MIRNLILEIKDALDSFCAISNKHLDSSKENVLNLFHLSFKNYLLMYEGLV